MNKRKQVLMWQLIAVGAAAFAVFKYKEYLKGGGKTMGDMNLNINPDKVMGLASRFVPKEWRPQANKLGKAILERMI